MRSLPVDHALHGLVMCCLPAYIYLSASARMASSCGRGKLMLKTYDHAKKVGK